MHSERVPATLRLESTGPLVSGGGDPTRLTTHLTRSLVNAARSIDRRATVFPPPRKSRAQSAVISVPRPSLLQSAVVSAVGLPYLTSRRWAVLHSQKPPTGDFGHSFSCSRNSPCLFALTAKLAALASLLLAHRSLYVIVIHDLRITQHAVSS